jgi:uncharacterized membrane protein YhaH (DUF805 family)
MTVGKFLFDFEGRISRSNWWLIYGLLCLSFFMFAIPILAELTISSVALTLANWTGMTGLGGKANSTFLVSGFLFLAYLVTAFVVSLAATVKRLHDRDMDGIWVLLFGCGPWVATFLALVFAMEQEVVLAILFNATSFVINFWALVALGCLRGTVGNNRFGADPLTLTAAASAAPRAAAAPVRDASSNPLGGQFMAAIHVVATVELTGVGDFSAYCLSVGTSELAATPGGLTIGRDPANAVFRIDDEKISRIHARLSYSDNAVFIEDADSANGTEINGKRLGARERRALRSGDRLKLGPALFSVTLR